MQSTYTAAQHLAHKAALEAAEEQRIIKFEPPFPCYHCGEPATVAILYRFEFLPKCKKCVEEMAKMYQEEE